MMDGVTVRLAEPDEAAEVIALLDGAMLAFDRDRVRAAIARADGYVAVRDDRVLGGIVLDDGEIVVIAVRPAVRRRGIGSQLVEVAAADANELRASFDASLRPFYAANGFTIEPASGDRFHGRR